MEPSRFKIVIAGDASVGKTTFINRHLTGEFAQKYIPTLGVDVHSLHFSTNYGPIVFDMWDTAGVERYGGLREAYSLKAKGLIVMFDTTSQSSYDNYPKWREQTLKVSPGIPVVVCGNKVDIKNRVVYSKTIKFAKGDSYYDISAKSNYNFEKPFLDLARKLMGRDDLEFIQSAPMMPTECS